MRCASQKRAVLLCLLAIWLQTDTFLPRAGLTKLDDANNAGGRSSEQCTLILTEGDSAKSLVVAGMSVAGRDNFGVFPLRQAACPVFHASMAIMHVHSVAAENVHNLL